MIEPSFDRYEMPVKGLSGDEVEPDAARNSIQVKRRAIILPRLIRRQNGDVARRFD
jgi:hypothetical protein